MANLVREQRIVDTTNRTVVKYTMTIDSAAANATLLDASTLNSALNANGQLMASNTHPLAAYRTSIKKIYGNVKSNGYIKLQWQGPSNSEIVCLSSGYFEFNLTDVEGGAAIPNNEAGTNGDIVYSIITPGSADCATIFIELRKDNRDFSAGQHVDPMAFNAGNRGFS